VSDAAKGWKFVEGMLAEEHLEQLGKMSEEQVREDLRTQGADPQRALRILDDVVAKTSSGQGRGGLSSGPARDPAKGWKFAEDLLAQEDLERLAGLSEQEIRKHLQERGVDAERASEILREVQAKHEAEATPPVAAPGLHAIKGGAGGKLPSEPSGFGRRAKWVSGLALAACLALVVALLTKDNGVTGSADPVRVREQAADACAHQAWAACLHWFDVAKELDPQGDTAPQVQEWRRKANAALGVEKGSPPNP
jgi:hypothetical protein